MNGQQPDQRDMNKAHQVQDGAPGEYLLHVAPRINQSINQSKKNSISAMLLSLSVPAYALDWD